MNTNIDLDLYKSPVEEIYELFNDIKAIHYLNEWDVIDSTDMTISYGSLVEVYNDMYMDVPLQKNISFHYYTLVD